MPVDSAFPAPCFQDAGQLASSGNEMDQDANGQPGQLLLDQYATPRPLNGTPFQSPYDPTTLPIIVPGPFLCQRKPATTQSAVRRCLTFAISRLPGR